MSPTPQTQEPVSSADLEALAEQLGRVPRGVVAIAARCVCGRPTVVRTAPRLDDGTPFPTSYYLTHPAAVKGCSTLEAEHLMETFNADLADDAELAAAYAAAHDDYLARRAELGQVSEIEGVSAGGMPTRVKCLHALAQAHDLVAAAQHLQVGAPGVVAVGLGDEEADGVGAAVDCGDAGHGGGLLGSVGKGRSRASLPLSRSSAQDPTVRARAGPPACGHRWG